MKMNSRMLVAAFVLVLCLTLKQVSGAVWWDFGCGPGYKEGDVKYSSGDQCYKCDCLACNTSSCYSCGTVYMEPKVNCYVDTEDKNAHYPICCEKRYFCNDDPEFNLEKYNDYWENEVIA